jgi:hypothetical protein
LHSSKTKTKTNTSPFSKEKGRRIHTAQKKEKETQNLSSQLFQNQNKDQINPNNK